MVKSSACEEWHRIGRCGNIRWKGQVGTLSANQVQSNSITAVDLFSGCGGMSLGFENAGFKVLAAFDNWTPAVEVYRKNFDHPIFMHDLSDIDASVPLVREFAPTVIFGGPPCQDFSTAGHQDENGGRAILSVAFAKIVSRVRPQWLRYLSRGGVWSYLQGA